MTPREPTTTEVRACIRPDVDTIAEWFRAWNSANARARHEYQRAPITSRSLPCATCDTGFSYGGREARCDVCIEEAS